MLLEPSEASRKMKIEIGFHFTSNFFPYFFYHMFLFSKLLAESLYQPPVSASPRTPPTNLPSSQDRRLPRSWTSSFRQAPYPPVAIQLCN